MMKTKGQKSSATLPDAPNRAWFPSSFRAGRGNIASLLWVSAVLVLVLLRADPAEAQQRTFHLDRLEVPGSPEDGLVLFRPTSTKATTFYAQLALGFSDSPLRTKNITSDSATIRRSNDSVINYQFTQYTNVGLQFLDRFTVGAAFPVTWGQSGQNPNYGASSVLGTPATTTVSTTGPAVGDMRIDLRGVILRSEDRKAALGGQFSFFAPTGTGSATNFGGDGSLTTMLMVSGEYSWRFVTMVANLGLHFRPRNSINNPIAGSGLGVGDELRLGIGGFVPFKDGKYRLGVTVFGQTGIQSGPIIGNTFFTGQNTPIEWNVEGRMKFGPKNNWFAGLGIGSFISQGYGAPDVRVVALVGTAVPILESVTKAPDARDLRREQWRRERRKAADTDKDGIPDDEDACPEEAEDGKSPDPTDGCPAPPDRDGDGLPDMYDKCPERAEDKDGIEDGDGCPEDDYDMDGVPDTEDACPREPGKPSKDKKKNGCAQFINFTEEGGIRIFEQVRFKTGSATILPESFPMLQEVADVLKANANVRRVTIEGHTDNRGSRDLNMRLSQSRAESVMKWLVEHGVASERLEAHGYGPDRPIESNANERGRTINRRVEFKILDETDINKPNMPPPKPKPQPKPQGDEIELD